MLSIVELIAGILIVVITLHEIFHAVVVPRWKPRRYRLAPILTGSLFWPAWKWTSKAIRSPRLRELHLGSFAPMAILLLLTVWIVALALGFALILLACNTKGVNPSIANFQEALYFAGASLFTMGSNDVVINGPISRFVILAAAFFGMAVMAMIISFLFTLYSSVQTREVTVNLIQQQAGAPPSGLKLLLHCAELDLIGDLPDMFADWRVWTSQILETHRAYPLLLHFRSSEVGISWITALQAVLDATAIVLSSIKNVPQGYAKLLHTIGSSTASQLYYVFALKMDRNAKQISRDDFAKGLRKLAEAGYEVIDSNEAYDNFTNLRATYLPALAAITEHLAHVSTRW